MNYFQESLKKFRLLPEYIRMAVGNDKVVKFINDLGKKYGNHDLKFIVILITIGELRIDDLPRYLTLKYKLSPEDGEKIQQELREKVFFGIEELITPEVKQREEINLNKNKEEVEMYFRGKIVSEIKHPKTFDESKELNDKILLAIYQDQDRKEIEMALYKNKEFLTKEKIMLDGKKSVPSVENWLKDFLKSQGSGFFNNLVLTKYITNSKNTRKLKADEKKIVERLITMYRNLKFFPNSLQGVPPEKWEIVVSNKKSLVPRKSLSIPKTKEETEIKNLQKMAEQYELGTLERRAIEEEIRKVKLNIKYQNIKK